MANYRTTVILKTDIVDSTPRLAAQTQAEMSLQRKQHKQFILETAAKNYGSIFQEEGDAYWIEFPSVTNACFAAIEMHQNLHAQQAGRGEKQRLAIRAVITAGDILHEGSDAMGMTMSLTARIEKITPPDEIYLSNAAWLLLNKAEVQTSFVNEINLKGFAASEKIYRVDQKHRVRTLANQFIVFTDIRGWTTFTKSRTVEEVEDVLIHYDDIMNRTCDSYGGTIRNTGGDQYFLTFTEAESLFAAIEDFCRSWRKEILERYPLGLSVAIQKGNLNIIRSYLFSNDIHVTQFLERLSPLNYPDKRTISIIVTEAIKKSADGTKWEEQFQRVDARKITDETDRELINEYGGYWFVLEETGR